jgi:hypothetical protein
MTFQPKFGVKRRAMVQTPYGMAFRILTPYDMALGITPFKRLVSGLNAIPYGARLCKRHAIWWPPYGMAAIV